MKVLVIKLAVLLIAVGSLIAAGSADAAKDTTDLAHPTPTPDRYANLSYNSGADDDGYLPDEAANTANILADHGIFAGSVNTAAENCEPPMSNKDRALIFYVDAQGFLDRAEISSNTIDSNAFRRSAVLQLTLAIELDPDNRTYLIERGRATEVPEVAIEDFTKAIVMRPNDPHIYIDRAKAYTKAAEYDSALADYQKAIDLKPNEPEFYRQRGAFFRIYLEDTDRALADLNKVIKLDPDDISTFKTRWQIFRNKKNYAKAVEEQTVFVRDSPFGFIALMERAETYVAMGKFSEAIADYTEEIGHDPGNTSIYRLRAKVYRKIGRPDLALKDEKKVEELEAKYKKLLSDESWDEK
jgi:tetratricopeptide (TPR) repeat protein